MESYRRIYLKNCHKTCITRWSAVADVRIMILAAFLDSCVLVEKGAEE
jgi:hypothetical protein